MGTNCAPHVADLFFFCYERDFMLSLLDNNQSDIIEAFNSTSRYLDDLAGYFSDFKLHLPSISQLTLCLPMYCADNTL